MKNQRMKKTVMTAGLMLLMLVLAAAAFVFGLRAAGKARLEHKAANVKPMLEQPAEEAKLVTEEEKVRWQEGWVRYKDEIYAYNEDIMTFLFMGIDKQGDVSRMEEGTDGGQADALFLLVLNPHTKEIQVIGINRNTMTDIDIYNEDGAYVTTAVAQLAVQHGFGDGMEESCQYQVDAVRRLFYNLPIHGYCAVHMDAVRSLTELLGGIDLIALEDVREMLDDRAGSTMIARKGESVHLDGDKAYSYVRYRNVSVEKSADMRLKRQQQFLEEFIKKARAGAGNDLTLPVKMYQEVTKQMVTDVTAEEVTYLASSILDYSFDGSQIYSIKGETVMGKQFEEFYVNEEDLYEMILDIFYEPVQQ